MTIEKIKTLREDIERAKSKLEVQTSQHGVALLTTTLAQANAALLLELTAPADDAADILPPEIPRDLLAQVVDEVFDGAIEDATVIEDIYRVIARSVTPPPAREGLNHDTQQAPKNPSGANGAGA